MFLRLQLAYYLLFFIQHFKSFLTTVPKMPVIKQMPSLSTAGNLPLFETFLKHKVLIIHEDFNVKINKDENKFCLHNLPNRNGEYLIDFSLENSYFMPKNKIPLQKTKQRTVKENYEPTLVRIMVKHSSITNS